MKYVYFVLWLLLCYSSHGQCGGMTYTQQEPFVLSGYQYQKGYNLFGDGSYQEITYTGVFEKGNTYYLYVHRRNDKAQYSIKVMSTKREVLFSSTDNHLHFTLPKNGLYYLVFEPIKSCSVCDCGIAVLSKKVN